VISQQPRNGPATGPDKSAVDQDKAALRQRLLAARRLLSPLQRAGAGQAIRDAVLSLPETQMAGTVAAYYSIGGEPDTHGLIYALWKRGSYVLLPVLRPDGDLDWASYEGPPSPCAGWARSRAPIWCWCPHWRWIIPACGSAVAVAPTTGL
jgi:5-formyltetrahydrofolate cyclo-ligase